MFLHGGEVPVPAGVLLGLESSIEPGQEERDEEIKGNRPRQVTPPHADKIYSGIDAGDFANDVYKNTNTLAFDGWTAADDRYSSQQQNPYYGQAENDADRQKLEDWLDVQSSDRTEYDRDRDRLNRAENGLNGNSGYNSSGGSGEGGSATSLTSVSSNMNGSYGIDPDIAGPRSIQFLRLIHQGGPDGTK